MLLCTLRGAQRCCWDDGHEPPAQSRCPTLRPPPPASRPPPGSCSPSRPRHDTASTPRRCGRIIRSRHFHAPRAHGQVLGRAREDFHVRQEVRALDSHAPRHHGHGGERVGGEGAAQGGPSGALAAGTSTASYSPPHPQSQAQSFELDDAAVVYKAQLAHCHRLGPLDDQLAAQQAAGHHQRSDATGDADRLFSLRIIVPASSIDSFNPLL